MIETFFPTRKVVLPDELYSGLSDIRKLLGHGQKARLDIIVAASVLLRLKLPYLMAFRIKNIIEVLVNMRPANEVAHAIEQTERLSCFYKLIEKSDRDLRLCNPSVGTPNGKLPNLLGEGLL